MFRTFALFVSLTSILFAQAEQTPPTTELTEKEFLMQRPKTFKPADRKSSWFGPKQDEKEQVLATKISNGMRVLIKRRPNLPNVCVNVFVLGSTLTETDANSGRAALLAGMLDKGTSDKTAEEIADYFHSIGGSLHIEVGRYTIIGNISVLKNDFVPATQILADCFLAPAFSNEKFEQVRASILEAIAARSENPSSELFEFFAQNLPKTTPFSRFENGTRESVEKRTVDDLKHHFKDYFVAENMLVAVLGDINPQEVLKTLEKSFGPVPSSPDFKPIGFDFDNTLSASAIKRKKTDNKFGLILMGFPMVDIFQEKEFSALRVLSAILSDGSGPSGWLFDELRGTGLVYHAQTSLQTGPSPGYFIVLTQSSPEKINEVIDRIDALLARVKRGEIPTDDFEKAKERIIAQHAKSNDTILAQSQQAGLDELYGFGYDYGKTFPERIRSTTLDDVVAAAQKFLTERLLVITSPNVEPEAPAESKPEPQTGTEPKAE